MKKKKLIILIFCCFNLIQIKAYTINKKETLTKEVSFFKFNKDSIQASIEFLKIKKLYKEKNYTKSLELSLKFLDKYSSKLDLNQNFYLYKTQIILGDIYAKINNHSNSIKYYKKAIKLLNSKLLDYKHKSSLLNKESEFGKIYLRIGSGYLRLGNRRIRRNKDLKINQKDSIKYKDSAKFYFKKSLKINSLDPKVLSYQGSASSNLSGMYMQDSLYDLAKNYAKKAVNIHRKRNNKTSEAAALGNLASIHLNLDNFELAKSTYKEALDLIKFENSDRAIRIKENLYENLAFNLYKLKDHEAYSFLESSYEIKDSLRDKEVRRIIEELGFKHNFEAKKQLLLKQEEVKLLKEKDKVKTLIVTGVTISIILLIIIGYYFMRQKNLELKITQSELLQNQKLDKLKSESQARILDATLNGKESERKEIAETLHDSVSALLSSANLHLQATTKQFNGTTPEEIHKTQEIITEASQKIRDLSHTLVSSVLLKFGLNFAVKDIAEKFSNSQLTIETDIKDIRRYHQDFEIKAYNIIQEFVNNILKHSKATRARIHLREINARLIVEIIDNGIGFDMSIIDTKDGLGINQIKARIQMMKGKFNTETSINNGTSIRVELPVLEKELVNLS